MHLIGFSHHYTKLAGQTFGELVAVSRISPSAAEVLPSGTVYYDTEYIDIHGNYQSAPLNPTENLQLIFIGNKQIPFTTYRESPKGYKPYYQLSPLYHAWDPYSDLIGETFAFKFKGEPLPEELSSRIYHDAVKIFK